METLVQSFCTRFENLLKEKGIAKIEIAQKLGIKKQTLSSYFNGDRIPKAEILIKLSEILDVSIDFLLTGKNFSTDNTNFVSNDEFSLVTLYRKLTDEERLKVKGYLEISNCRFPKYENILLEDSDSIYSYSQSDSPIPVVGKVAAGLPIDAIENILAYINTDIPNVQFALYAKGNSMEPVIHDSEIILVHKTPELEDGEIGIFRIEDEATCKIFHNYNDRIELCSFNPNFRPIIYLKKDLTSFEIDGKVILTPEQKNRLINETYFLNYNTDISAFKN